MTSEIAVLFCAECETFTRIREDQELREHCLCCAAALEQIDAEDWLAGLAGAMGLRLEQFEHDECHGCGGAGEVPVSSGALGHEDWLKCMTCGGSGTHPTATEIAELREQLLEAKADLHVLQVRTGEAG